MELHPSDFANPVSIALQMRGLHKKSQLARELVATTAFKDVGRRSLEAYLGKLERGDHGWWEKRPELLEAFAKHVDLELGDLGIGRPSVTTAHGFPGFPALRPLDLALESPPAIYRDLALREHWEFDPNLWLDPVKGRGLSNPGAGLYWLQIPRGCGLSLLWKQLLAQDRAQCVDLKVLDRTPPPPGGARPIILRVAQPADHDELDAIAASWLKSPTLVLSRHAPPIPPEAPDPLPAFQVRALGTHWHSPIQGGMRRELVPTWRDRLIEWVLDRLEDSDTLLSKDDTERWIGQLVSWRSVIGSPRELMTLCGLLHRLGRKADRFLDEGGGNALLRACLDNRVHADQLAKALRHRYLEEGSSWQDPLPPEQWISHLDADLPRSKNIEASLAAVAEGKSVAQRKQAAFTLLKEWTRSSISELEGEFGLSDCGDRRYQVSLPFVADMMAADAVSSLVNDRSVAQWTRLYLDPSRRQAADIALSRRPVATLIADADDMLCRATEPVLALAAEDALFWAIGLKLAEPMPDLPASAGATLQALSRRVLGRMWNVAPRLWSRDLHMPDTALTWLTICWAWSLHVDPPEGLRCQIDDMAWLFPGWASPERLLSFAACDFPTESTNCLEANSGDVGRQAWAMWWAVAQDVVDRLDAAPVDPPLALMPALMLRALRRKLPIESQWLVAAATSKVAGVLMQGRLNRLEPQAKEQLLDALLEALAPGNSLVISEQQSKPSALKRELTLERISTSWLAREICEGFDSETALRIARPERFVALLRCLNQGSTSVISALAKAIPVSPEWEQVFLQVLSFRPQRSWEVAARWLAKSPGDEIAIWLWKEDPNATAQLLRSGDAIPDAAALHLIENAPFEQIRAVADFVAVSQLPLLQLRRRAWAAEVLPIHGVKLAKLIEAIALDGRT